MCDPADSNYSGPDHESFSAGAHTIYIICKRINYAHRQPNAVHNEPKHIDTLSRHDVCMYICVYLTEQTKGRTKSGIISIQDATSGPSANQLWRSTPLINYQGKHTCASPTHTCLRGTNTLKWASAIVCEPREREIMVWRVDDVEMLSDRFRFGWVISILFTVGVVELYAFIENKCRRDGFTRGCWEGWLWNEWAEWGWWYAETYSIYMKRCPTTRWFGDETLLPQNAIDLTNNCADYPLPPPTTHTERCIHQFQYEPSCIYPA